MNSDRYKIKNIEDIKQVLDTRRAPRITECKKTYQNSEICVKCRLIGRESNRVSLFYAIEKRWNINGMVILEPPMFTIAKYWADRPYNLYCWFNPD